MPDSTNANLERIRDQLRAAVIPYTNGTAISLDPSIVVPANRIVTDFATGTDKATIPAQAAFSPNGKIADRVDISTTNRQNVDLTETNLLLSKKASYWDVSDGELSRTGATQLFNLGLSQLGDALIGALDVNFFNENLASDGTARSTSNVNTNPAITSIASIGIDRVGPDDSALGAAADNPIQVGFMWQADAVGMLLQTENGVLAGRLDSDQEVKRGVYQFVAKAFTDVQPVNRNKMRAIVSGGLSDSPTAKRLTNDHILNGRTDIRSAKPVPASATPIFAAISQAQSRQLERAFQQDANGFLGAAVQDISTLTFRTGYIGRVAGVQFIVADYLPDTFNKTA